MYEVFDPHDGGTVYSTRFPLLARLIAYLRGLDYALAGEGWVCGCNH